MDPLRLRLAPILALALGLVLVLAARPTSAVTPPGQVWVPPLPDPVVPTNENAAKAGKAYKLSVKRYERGDFKRSFKAADRMYKLLPNASTALYRAELFEDLNKPCDALAGFLVSFDLDPTEDEEPDIMAGLSRAGSACEGGFGWAQIEVNPPDAEVRISGQRVPTERTLGLMAGDQTVEISAPGYIRAQIVLPVAAGQRAAARFELKRVGAEATPMMPAPGASGSPGDEEIGMPTAPPLPANFPRTYKAAGPDHTVAWLLMGGGAALVAGGVAMHLWAVSTREESNDYARPRDNISEQERLPKYNELRDAAKTRSIMAYALYGGGAAALGTGVFLYLREPSSDASWAALAPVALGGGGGLVLSGGW